MLVRPSYGRKEILIGFKIAGFSTVFCAERSSGGVRHFIRGSLEYCLRRYLHWELESRSRCNTCRFATVVAQIGLFLGTRSRRLQTFLVSVREGVSKVKSLSLAVSWAGHRPRIFKNFLKLVTKWLPALSQQNNATERREDECVFMNDSGRHVFEVLERISW